MFREHKQTLKTTRKKHIYTIHLHIERRCTVDVVMVKNQKHAIRVPITNAGRNYLLFFFCMKCALPCVDVCAMCVCRTIQLNRQQHLYFMFWFLRFPCVCVRVVRVRLLEVNDIDAIDLNAM